MLFYFCKVTDTLFGRKIENLSNSSYEVAFLGKSSLRIYVYIYTWLISDQIGGFTQWKIILLVEIN